MRKTPEKSDLRFDAIRLVSDRPIGRWCPAIGSDARVTLPGLGRLVTRDPGRSRGICPRIRDVRDVEASRDEIRGGRRSCATHFRRGDRVESVRRPVESEEEQPVAVVTVAR